MPNVSLVQRMPSTGTKVVTGVVAAVVLAYSLVVAQQVLLGVVAASLVVVVGWVLTAGRESDAVRSLGSPYWVTAFVFAFAVLAYSLVVAQQLLFGFVTASLILLAAAASYLGDRGYAPSMGRGRTLAVAALSVLVLAYALLVAQQVLLGLVAVVLVVLVAWVTSPNGPFGGA